MGDKTKIVDRGGARVRFYLRKTTGRPGTQERRLMAAAGLQWCRSCTAWKLSTDVRDGICAQHRREYERSRYATDADYRDRRIAHSNSRARGVAPVPVEVRDCILEEFSGECAYCSAAAETWDHVIPVAKGGKTVPDNILPACTPCNSSKKSRDLDTWLTDTGREMKMQAKERLAYFGGLDAH